MNFSSPTFRCAAVETLRWALAVFVICLLGGFTASAEPVGVPEMKTADGFALPQPGRVFRFPEDHGSHPEFRIEWWYVTGHLMEEGGKRHGFQATFFRRAGVGLGLTNSGLKSGGSTNFASDELFLAHMAWLDATTGRFIHEERLNRRGWDAEAAVGSLRVRNGNWSLRDTGESAPGASGPVMELVGGVQAEVGWTLRLQPTKPLAVFGTNGVSRKAKEPWAASHYLTYPRIAVTGTMRRAGSVKSVAGEAWMDHEFSSSQMGQGQVGWDWASVQLRDGRELMVYRMRRDDGTTDPFSVAAWIDAKGMVHSFGAGRFQWIPQGSWKSPRSGAEYPGGAEIRVPTPDGMGTEILRLKPLAADQELSGVLGAIPYWEGACRVLDAEGREVGNAFLEMTGYAGALRKAL